MSKNETGITDTGEQEFPLAQKQRRATSGHQNDAQAQMGDGVYQQDNARSTATNYGRPALRSAARKRMGMR